MHPISWGFFALALAAAAPPAAPGDVDLIAFPESAGKAEFVGIAIDRSHRRCRVKESTGNATADAFACSVGPQQRKRIDGQVYAMTWVPPAYKGVYVPASRRPAKEEPLPKLPGRVVSTGAEFVRSLVQRLVIDEHGRVLECVIESSSDPAEDAFLCRFERERGYIPATLEGVPVSEVRYEIVKMRRQTVVTASPA